MTPLFPLAPVPPEFVAIAVRAAAEGIPVGAIARALKVPYDRVLLCVQRAKQSGAITEIPRADWPVNQPIEGRAPTTALNKLYPAAHIPAKSGPPEKSGSAALPHEDVEFLCRHVFHLTNLEAGFLVVLLRCLFAEKEKLHAVIEQQRAARPLRPDRQEVTDVKMVDVMICKLRKKLTAHAAGGFALQVRTSWGKGYFLDPAVKETVYRILDGGVASSPA